MITVKRLLVPERLRRLPAQFSWLDQRLVRDRHIERCDAHALSLYLFLVTVADAQGLSYYSEGSIAKRVSMPPERLRAARAELLRVGLIAYEAPLYQVLSLEPRERAAPELSREQSLERLGRLRAILDGKRARS